MQVLIKYILCASFLMVCRILLSQVQETDLAHMDPQLQSLNNAANYDNLSKVMIIPFEPKLYNSDVDNAIAHHTGLSHTQIKQRLRQGLLVNLLLDAKQNHAALLMNDSDRELVADLQYIYNSIGYQYRPVPENEVVEKKPLIEKLWKKKDNEQEKNDTRIENGQITGSADNLERYMSTRIINPNMCAYLSKKYEVGVFVFINQLDILSSSENDYRDYASEDYKREIRVHYTLLDYRGNEIAGGMAKNYFSSEINDMNVIVKKLFPEITSKIAAHIPVDIETINSKEIITEKEQSGEKKEKDLMRQY